MKNWNRSKKFWNVTKKRQLNFLQILVEKKSATSSDCRPNNLLLGDAESVLKSQVATKKRNKVHLKPSFSGIYSHLFNAKIVKKSDAAAEKVVRKSSTTNISWKYERRDSIQFAMVIHRFFQKVICIFESMSAFLLQIAHDFLELPQKVASKSHQLWQNCVRAFARGRSNSNRTAKQRNLVKSWVLLKEANRRCLLFQQTIVEFSILSIPPDLHQFPTLGFHASVDVMVNFRFEAMHELALGLSKMLKEFSIIYQSDPNRMTEAIKYRWGEPKTFQSIKQTIPSVMNEFFESTESQSCTNGLKKDFCKREVGHKVSDFITETRILRVLEAAYYNKIDLLSPFFETVVDVCCRNFKMAPIIELFTLYVILVNKIFKMTRVFEWAEEAQPELRV